MCFFLQLKPLHQRSSQLEGSRLCCKVVSLWDASTGCCQFRPELITTARRKTTGHSRDLAAGRVLPSPLYCWRLTDSAADLRRLTFSSSSVTSSARLHADAINLPDRLGSLQECAVGHIKLIFISLDRREDGAGNSSFFRKWLNLSITFLLSLTNRKGWRHISFLEYEVWQLRHQFSLNSIVISQQLQINLFTPVWRNN